jgi:hypothetical protein
MQYVMLDACFASGKATFTIPLYISTTSVLILIQGGLLFGDFASCLFDAARTLGFGLSIAATILGQVLASYFQEQRASSRETSTHVNPKSVEVEGKGAPASAPTPVAKEAEALEAEGGAAAEGHAAGDADREPAASVEEKV